MFASCQMPYLENQAASPYLSVLVVQSNSNSRLSTLDHFMCSLSKLKICRE
jgi:hypothetical protein